MGTSSTSAGTFTGSSSFSSSLAQVISRAVSIASLPMQMLQNQQSTLQSRQSELQTLSNNFSSLGTALSSLDSATGAGSYSASLSDTNVASASVSSGVMAGTYSITVSNTGANTNAMSNDSGLTRVTDPAQGNISTSTDFTLWVNSTPHTISDSAGTLSGLASAINASGANVQATVVNVGSSSSPDYRLSVQSLDFAPDTIQLNDNGNGDAPLLTQLSGGAYVQYQVNGEPSNNSGSRSLALSPGLTVSVLGTGTTTVTVSQNGNAIANVLSSFAYAYNAAVDELNKSRGQNGGALSGDSIVYSLTQSLHELTSYSAGSGNVASIADLGLTFDQSGHLNFDVTAFSHASNMTDLLSFLGSAADGTGFLGAATSTLNGINDATSGILTQATQNMSSEITSLGNQITADQTKINLLQQNLMAQMAAADAAIATLEQQASYFQMMFQTENANAQLGY